MAQSNIVNGLSEPIRAGEKIAFGTNYIPEMPKMSVAETSEYWNKDGRMIANKGGEIAATIAFGGVMRSKATATQTGRTILGIESTYNIGAGLAGKDVTQTDANGNARQMEWLERGTRIAGGLFGAKQTIKTEISTPNSITNKAIDKFDDIFTNPPTFKPQTEAITPEGLKVKINDNTFEKPLQTADDLNLEMRGRGGFESNYVFENVGTKIPKVKQPFEVTPSMKPNAVNRPLSEAEKIRPNSALENIRGLTRQNEAAETLAKNGYKVEQKPQITNIDRMSNPWLKAEKKPDFKIEGEIFDAYAPDKTTSAKSIRDYIENKIEDKQTRRIVLNLDDSPIHLDDLKSEIWEKPILELEQILIVKNGNVENFFPFR